MRVHFLFLASLLVVLPSSALAADTQAYHSVTEARSLTVTATRLAAFPELDSSSITVIDREEIERSGAHDVGDLLRFVPGVEVRRSGQTGQQASVFLRGANSNQTLALVDGVPVNGPFTGTTDFASLPVAGIERIELVRGPQSLLYGSEALGGIINVVTRRGEEGVSGSVRAGAGSNERYESRAHLGVGGETARAAITGAWLRTDNERLNSGYRSGDLAFTGDWDFASNYSLQARASVHDARNNIPNDRFTDDPNDKTTQLDKRVAVTLDGAPRAGWDLSLTAAHAKGRAGFLGLEPNPPWFGGDSESRTDDRRNYVDLQNVVDLGGGHRLLAGATYEELEADLFSTSGFGDTELESRQDSRSLFAAVNLRPRDGLELNAGARSDDYSSFGSHGTWRAGGRLRLTDVVTIRANAGTGFRAPSLADLYYPGFGNADLQPEESLGWDVGLRAASADGRLHLGLTWFANDFDDLIVYSSESFRPENIAEARTAGLESDLTVRLGDRWTVQAAYTWMSEAEDVADGSPLLRRAEHSGSLAVYADPTPRLRCDLRVNLVGDAPDVDYSGFPAADVTNPGHASWDLGVAAHVTAQVAVDARVTNLFDADYEEAFGFPALGREVRAGSTVSF